MTDSPRRILVIKLGALGDVVQALGPMAAIRRHHAGGHVTLLTTPPYEDFLKASGLADEIWLDQRPRAFDVGGWLALRRRLRAGAFARVYDLQTSDRSSFYFRLFWPGPWPEWSGIARGCSHPHANPGRDLMHTLERQAEQLRMAGIGSVPPPDLAWADADLGGFALPERFVLLAPGGAGHRPAKRWPASQYAELAGMLAARGLTPVIIGTRSEAAVLDAVAQGTPQALNLMGRTSLLDLAGLARRAVAAVGNDTGPMHLVAAAGCRAIVLYSCESDPALCAQRGPRVTILRRPDLASIAAEEVAAHI